MNADAIIPPAAAIVSIIGVLVTGGSVVKTTVQGPLYEASAVYEREVRAGETILPMWKIQKRTDCPGENSRIWDGADGFHLAEPHMFNGLPRMDEPKSIVIPTKVPDLAPPGDLELHVVGFVQCEGMKRQYFSLGPLRLTVVE